MRVTGRQRHLKCDAYFQFTALLLSPSLQKNPTSFTLTGRHKRQQGFYRCGNNLEVFCHQSNPKHRQSSRLKHTFKDHLRSPAVDLFRAQTS